MTLETRIHREDEGDWRDPEFPMEFSIGNWDVGLEDSASGGMITGSFSQMGSDGKVVSTKVLSFRVDEIEGLNGFISSLGKGEYPVFKFTLPVKPSHF